LEEKENTNLCTEEKQFIDLRNIFYQSTFAQEIRDELWLSTKDSYPSTCSKAVKFILPFASPWLCEYGFLALTEIEVEKETFWY